MDNHVHRMKALLQAAGAAVGVANANQVTFDEHGRFFAISETWVEVALERNGGQERWRVREIYEVPDLNKGGFEPVSGTVAIFDIGDETIAAKTAIMKILEQKVDVALDEAS